MNYKKIDKNKAQCKLYGNIGDWMTNGETFSQMLDEIAGAGYSQLEFREHCYGGSVFEGNVMMNSVESSELDISVLVEGLAASMGFLWLMSIPKEKISICENAFGMIHRPSSMIMGDADDHLSAANLMKSMEVDMIKKISARSGIAEDEVKTKWFDGKDHWLNADEMVKHGFAGKKVKPVAASVKALDKQIIESSTQETIYARFAAELDKNLVINKNKKIMNLALLIAAFSLTGVTAESPEADVIAALQKKFQALNDKVTNMENEAKAKVTIAIKAELDSAQAAGKFVAGVGQTVETVRATYQSIGETSGIETLKTVLAGMGSKAPIASFIKNESKGAPAAGVQNWDWYQKNNPSALEAMEKEDPDQFKELFKAEYGTYPG